MQTPGWEWGGGAGMCAPATDHDVWQNSQVQSPLLPPLPQLTRDNRAVPHSGVSRTFGNVKSLGKGSICLQKSPAIAAGGGGTIMLA